jgi:hypothetical protein
MALVNADTIANSAGTGAPAMSFGMGVPLARYKTSAAPSFTATTAALINFGTQDYDTHSAVTTGASWKFTAPYAGKYRVTALVHENTASALFNGNQAWRLILAKTGTTTESFLAFDKPSSLEQKPAIFGSGTISLTAGESFGVVMNSDVNITLENDATINWIAIEYLGT